VGGSNIFGRYSNFRFVLLSFFVGSMVYYFLYVMALEAGIDGYVWRWFVNSRYFEKVLKLCEFDKDKSTVVVSITDDCLEEYFGKVQHGFERRKACIDFLERLSMLKNSSNCPKVILFDILFELESPYDKEFSRLLEKIPAVLAVRIDNSMLVPSVVYPAKLLRQKALDFGIVNVELDKDGILRKYRLYYKDFGEKTLAYAAYYYSAEKLCLFNAERGVGQSSSSETLLRSNLEKVSRKEGVLNKSLTDRLSSFRVVFPKEREDMIEYSMSQVLKMSTEELTEAFKDKVVFVGDVTSRDWYSTDMGLIPGVYWHSYAYKDLKHRKYLKSNKMLDLIIAFISLVILFDVKSKNWVIRNILYIPFVAGVFFIGLVFNQYVHFGALCFSWFMLFLTVGAVKYRYLYEEERLKKLEKERELEVIKKIATEVQDLTDLDAILKNFLEEVVQAVGCERASVMLWDAGAGGLVVKAVWPSKFAEGEKIILKKGEGIAGKVFSDGDWELVDSLNKIKKGEVEFKEKGLSVGSVRNLLCYPLSLHGRTVGVLNVVNLPEGVLKNVNDYVELLKILTSQVSGVVESARLYEMATKDGLTGLFVRRYFDMRIEEEIARARRYGKEVALLMTDIDHFKSINDRYGHQVGDEVLKAVAQVIKSIVRKIDIPCRYGGEEFAVILPETAKDGAIVIAERIRKTVASETIKGIRVTISIGVGIWQRGESVESFIKRVDRALYTAKETGRNRVVFADIEDEINGLEPKEGQ